MGPDEFSGFELADYEESVQSAVKDSFRGTDGNLMLYFSEERNPGVKAKVLSAIPSVELRDGELMGCTTVRLKEPLDKVEMSALQEYLLGQFSDGWARASSSGKSRLRMARSTSIFGKRNPSPSRWCRCSPQSRQRRRLFPSAPK